MENSQLVILISGIVVTVFMVLGGVFSLKRQDMNALKEIDSMASTGSRVWFYLTQEQQEELNKISSLLVQEEWVEEHVELSVMNGVSAERVLIELANRGFVVLGQGVFRRHSSPLDFITPKATADEPFGVQDEETTTSLEPDVEQSNLDEENAEKVEEGVKTEENTGEKNLK